MSDDSKVTVSPQGGVLSTRLRILKAHIGVTAVDLWDDTDHNGRPDKFIRRIKAPNIGEEAEVTLGTPAEFIGKVIQWIWMPSLPPDIHEDWAIEIQMFQAHVALKGFPLALSGAYPQGKGFGIFQTWFAFVGK